MASKEEFSVGSGADFYSIRILQLTRNTHYGT